MTRVHVHHSNLLRRRHEDRTDGDSNDYSERAIDLFARVRRGDDRVRSDVSAPRRRRDPPTHVHAVGTESIAMSAQSFTMTWRLPVRDGATRSARSKPRFCQLGKLRKSHRHRHKSVTSSGSRRNWQTSVSC
jgi:hypothetical protein